MYSGGYAYGVWMTGGPVVSPVGLAEQPPRERRSLKKRKNLRQKNLVEEVALTSIRLL